MTWLSEVVDLVKVDQTRQNGYLSSWIWREAYWRLMEDGSRMKAPMKEHDVVVQLEAMHEEH